MSDIKEFEIAIKNISDAELLDGVRLQIINSINHLNESILLIYKEKLKLTKDLNEENVIRDNELRDDLNLYDESIFENKEVLKKNFKKLTMVDNEINKRSLKISDSNNTYTLKSLEEICSDELNDYKLIEQDADLVDINCVHFTNSSKEESINTKSNKQSEDEQADDGVYL